MASKLTKTIREVFTEASEADDVAVNMPRIMASTVLTTPLSTGVLRVVPIYLQAGQWVQKILLMTSADASVQTACQVGLYSESGQTLLASCANTGSVEPGPDTCKAYTMTTAYHVPSNGVYLVGIVQAASTPMTLLGVNVASATILAGSYNGNNGASGLTALPSTIGTVTPAVGVPWVGVQ